MKIIRFIQGGEVIQLGFEKKVIYVKWGSLLKPMNLGTLAEIKQMGNLTNVKLGKNTQKVPLIIKQMANNITKEGLIYADSLTDKQFYEDFLKDYKEMSSEGQLNFIGEFNEWA